MKIIEVLDIPIYNTNVLLFLGGNIEDFEFLYENNKTKFTKEEYNCIINDLQKDGYAGFVSCINDFSYFLCVKENYIKDYSIVIHEIFHLTNHILWDRDVDIDKKGEAYAYLIGWLSKQYFNIIEDVENKEREEVDNIVND
jgi:hypothetical protein